MAMMYWDGNGWSWVGWLVMSLTMVAFWGSLAWIVVTLVRRPPGSGSSAQDILDERFARGEIDDEEYRRRKASLSQR